VVAIQTDLSPLWSGHPHSKMLDPPLRATSFRCGAQPTQHGVDNSWIIIDVVLSSSSESTAAAAAASAPLCYTPLNDQW